MIYIILIYLCIGSFIAGMEFQEQTGGGSVKQPVRAAIALIVWLAFGPLIYLFDWVGSFLAWLFKQIDRYDIVRFVFVFHFYPNKYMWSQAKLGEFNWMVHTEHAGTSINDRLFRWAMLKINKRNSYTFDLEGWKENGKKS